MALTKIAHDVSNSVIRIVFCAVLLILIGLPAKAADPSGWSDKTLCRVMDGDPDNANYQAEAKRRQIKCANGVITAASKTKPTKKAENRSSLPVMQGIQSYSLALLPEIKEELLSVAINKTDFDFSNYQLAYFENPMECAFDIRRVDYNAAAEGRIEDWNIAYGFLTLYKDKLTVNGQWRMGGLSTDRSYIKNEINLKLTKDGHLVGKMAFFNRHVSTGEALVKPSYVELLPHKRSQPFDLQSPSKTQIWIDVDEWAGAVLFVRMCF